MTDYITKAIAKITRCLIKSRTEPIIKYKCSKGLNRQDNCYWKVYDPVSGFNGSFGSEGEVRNWLDRRYGS